MLVFVLGVYEVFAAACFDVCCRIFEEVELLHLMNHENVLEVQGYTCWEGHVGVLTEYASAGRLETLLLKATNEPSSDLFIPIILRLRFCVDIASGLVFLQENGLPSFSKLAVRDVLLSSDFRCKVSIFKFSNVTAEPDQRSDEILSTDVTCVFADICYVILLLSEVLDKPDRRNVAEV